MPYLLVGAAGLVAGLLASDVTDDIKSTAQWVVIGGVAYLIAKGTRVI